MPTHRTALTRSLLTDTPKGLPAGGKLRVRRVMIFNGETFLVPQCIQRIDSTSTHGWQVRYHGTKMFSDHTRDGRGAEAALAKATKELLARIAAHPAPVVLQRAPSSNKTSGLPAGISGPIVRVRPDRGTRTAALSVLLPQFNDKPRVRSVYIGSERTYTLQRFRAALAKAKALRAEAMAAYAQAATRARRAAARELKATIKR
ncbi:MAG: hypothetical protein OEW27_00800 [Aquincola sp.]|nr:hypothetical protein [Aquincola sp.]MDH5328463.1 hypothetical protein [Aquincola sp.]